MQLSLIDPPIARRTDPVTSHAGAEAKTRSGSRTDDQQTLRALIQERPGLTAMELGNLLYRRGMQPLRAFQVASKRISDLERRGAVLSVGRRKCNITGHQARIWRATDQ